MTFLDVVKTILPLFLIVGLLYGVLYFVKKYGVSLKGNKSCPVSINVLSSQMIMPKKFISVIKVDDKFLLLGISDHSITLLKEIDQPEEAVAPLNDEYEKNSFLSLLKKNLGMK